MNNKKKNPRTTTVAMTSRQRPVNVDKKTRRWVSPLTDSLSRFRDLRPARPARRAK